MCTEQHVLHSKPHKNDGAKLLQSTTVTLDSHVLPHQQDPISTHRSPLSRESPNPPPLLLRVFKSHSFKKQRGPGFGDGGGRVSRGGGRGGFISPRVAVTNESQLGTREAATVISLSRYTCILWVTNEIYERESQMRVTNASELGAREATRSSFQVGSHSRLSFVDLIRRSHS